MDADEKFVRDNWIWVCLHTGKRLFSLSFGGEEVKLPTRDGILAVWSAAAEFTRSRLEQIARLQTSLDWMNEFGAGNGDDSIPVEGLKELAKTARAELKRGMK